MTNKIVTIIGARPQFVKAAVVSRALRKISGIAEVLVHTGQHYDDNMSAVFFDELSIPPPGYHLGVGSGMHGAQTGLMLSRIEEVLIRERPDWVLIYGDTNSTMAGALAAAKLHIPVAHVEAGLRSFNRSMPEEINRIVSDHVSDVLYAPTTTAMANLTNEGLSAKSLLVGDVMYDAAIFHGAQASDRKKLLDSHNLEQGNYLLVTVHRAENTDSLARLTAIVDALINLAMRYSVVFPIHPRTLRVLQEANLMTKLEVALIVLPPCGYLDMVALQKNAALIITDSGGVQKEAMFFGVPCVTLRDETEWVETLEGGWNILAPPNSAVFIQGVVEAALTNQHNLGARTSAFGDGKAAVHIVEDLIQGIRRRAG